MMEIMEFCEKVKRNLLKCLGEDTAATVKKVTKNNGVVLHSIIISQKDMNISPNIYLDEFYKEYENGETFRNIMDEILKVYEESKLKESVDISFFLDYEKIKNRVVYKLISYEKNKELLLQIPYIPFLDMAIVFYCYVPQKQLGNATILIYNNHLKLWEVTKEQLYQAAKCNTERMMPARILSIEEVMKEIFARDIIKSFSKDTEDEEWADQVAGQMLTSMIGDRQKGRMYVLGNENKMFGAAVILYSDLLGKISEKISKNFYILPSSIHEVIIIPDDDEAEAEDLWKMVCDINRTQVEPEEVLTDSVYYFSGKCKKIEKLF